MNDLREVKKRARALVGDPDGDFATDAYLLPLINQFYEQAIHKLEETCSPFITLLQVVPALPAGTTSLVAQQKPNQPLFGLINPLDIEYKQTGLPETNYIFAVERNILPNTSPTGSPQIRGMDWEYRSFVLYVTPLPYIADLRVRGEFRPPPLKNDDDIIVIHPLMGACLAYGAASLIGSERQNQNYKTDYGAEAQDMLDDIEAELVRQTQGTTSRVGRMNRGNRGSRGSFYNGSQ